MDFNGKVAIVTGAASGIGKSVSELYAREGAAVVLSDINQELGERTTEEIRKAGGEAIFVRADVSKPSDCENMVKTTLDKYGRLDFACNNAGIGDAVTITLAYNAGSTTADFRDVYLFFYNPSAAGYNSDPRVFVVSKTNLASGGPALDPRADIQDVVAGADAYLPAAKNLGGAKTETLFGDYILLDGAADGTWQIVGIIADSAKINCDDPSTWDAWDVASLILGKPWTGSPYTLCK